MANMEIAFEHDVKHGKYTMRHHDGVCTEAIRVRRGKQGQLLAKADIFNQHGSRLTGGNIDLLNPQQRMHLAREGVATNGMGPDYLVPHLNLFADAVDKEIPLTEHADEQRSLRVTQLSKVIPERVDFLWKPFLPVGRPVALEGDPDVGKSTLVTKIVAHITTGTPFPTVIEGAPPALAFTPRNVCLLSSEADPADTIRPRVEVNGGDADRVYMVEG